MFDNLQLDGFILYIKLKDCDLSVKSVNSIYPKITFTPPDCKSGQKSCGVFLLFLACSLLYGFRRPLRCFFFFFSWQHVATNWFHWLEKNSLSILQNILFCVLQKSQSDSKHFWVNYSFKIILVQEFNRCNCFVLSDTMQRYVCHSISLFQHTPLWFSFL